MKIDEIIGLGAFALYVGVLTKVYIDGEGPTASPTDDENPFDTPELREIRTEIDTKMEKIRERRRQSTLHK